MSWGAAMRIKLDENLGTRGASLLREAGHAVATVAEQGLCSASDRRLIGLCRAERRCLVTLDLDFANPLLFTPRHYSGIAVLRIPPKPEFGDILCGVETLIAGLAHASIEGELWIIQKGRIRKYQPDN